MNREVVIMFDLVLFLLVVVLILATVRGGLEIARLNNKHSSLKDSVERLKAYVLKDKE